MQPHWQRARNQELDRRPVTDISKLDQFCHPTNIKVPSSIQSLSIRLPTKTQPIFVPMNLVKALCCSCCSFRHAYARRQKFWILFDVSALPAVSVASTFAFLRVIPPRLTIQNGVRATSTKCVGSQRIPLRLRVGLLHAQNQSFGGGFIVFLIWVIQIDASQFWLETCNSNKYRLSGLASSLAG